MNDLSDEQAKELKEFVEDVGLDLYDDQMEAKSALADLCDSMGETIGIKKAHVLKMVKTLWKSCLEEDKAKFEEFDDLYRKVIG